MVPLFMSIKNGWMHHNRGPINPVREDDLVEVACRCKKCERANKWWAKLLFIRPKRRIAYAGEVPWEVVSKYRVIQWTMPSIGYWPALPEISREDSYTEAVIRQEQKKTTKKHLTLVKG